MMEFDDLKNFKTTPATLRAALQSRGVYLPNHKKNYTSVFYMKEIIAGTKFFLRWGELIPCFVPQFKEC